MEYITGPPPPPAPVAKLNLPGGKKTKKAKPLWLTYRELADNELRKAANELFHEDYPLEDPTLEDDDDDHPRRSKTVKVESRGADRGGCSRTSTASAPSATRRCGPQPRPGPRRATSVAPPTWSTGCSRSTRSAASAPRWRSCMRRGARSSRASSTGPMPPRRTPRRTASTPRAPARTTRSPRTTTRWARRSRRRARTAGPTSAVPSRSSPTMRRRAARPSRSRAGGRPGCCTPPLAPALAAMLLFAAGMMRRRA